MSQIFPNWFMAMLRSDRPSTSDEDEPKTEVRADLEAKLEAEPKAESEAKLEAKLEPEYKAELEAGIEAEPKPEPEPELEPEPKAESEAEAGVETEHEAEHEAEVTAELATMEDHNSKSSTSTPPDVEELSAQISDKLRRAVELVCTCCLQASILYIQDFRAPFETADEKDHDTELGRRCYQIYRERKATDCLRTNTGTICHILDIQVSAIADLLSRPRLAGGSEVQKLCRLTIRIEEAQEVFKSLKVDDEDPRLRGVFASGISYCQMLHREDKAREIREAATRFHKGKFDVTRAQETIL
ncbi:hypothetical protein ACHAP5_001822 [Fusarium lateritium]